MYWKILIALFVLLIFIKNFFPALLDEPINYIFNKKTEDHKQLLQKEKEQQLEAHEMDKQLFKEISEALQPNLIDYWRNHDMEQYFSMTEIRKLDDIIYKFKTPEKILHDQELEKSRSSMLIALSEFLQQTGFDTFYIENDLQGILKEWRDSGDKQKIKRHEEACNRMNSLKDKFINCYDEFMDMAKKKLLC